jgi:hypothetical protein
MQKTRPLEAAQVQSIGFLRLPVAVEKAIKPRCQAEGSPLGGLKVAQ